MEKQIEEMAWELCDIPKHPSIKSCEQCGNKHCHAIYYAERAINKGYRKVEQGEWISVEDRLPDEYETVLTVYSDETMGTDYICFSGDWFHYGEPTHWMPMPQPPKMKGAE